MAAKFSLRNRTLSVRQDVFSPRPLFSYTAIGSGFIKEFDFLN